MQLLLYYTCNKLLNLFKILKIQSFALCLSELNITYAMLLKIPHHSMIILNVRDHKASMSTSSI